MPKAGSVRQDVVSALLVGDFGDDRLVVHDVFRQPGWRLLEASTGPEAIRCLERNRVHVVVAGTDLPGWNWKQALADLRHMAAPPQLVVASHAADDQLWSEVLNLGAYDLLARPLCRDEVERVLVSARRHCDFKSASAREPGPGRVQSAAA